VKSHASIIKTNGSRSSFFIEKHFSIGIVNKAVQIACTSSLPRKTVKTKAWAKTSIIG
jgi:hypothetical protein